ncbi:MAG: ABC transporter ATP-binding protein [Kineosporiaceae bacterium]
MPVSPALPSPSVEPRQRLAPRASARRWWHEAVVQRWLALVELRHAPKRMLALLVLVDVALGLLPLGFVLATSTVVGRVPAAVEAGVGSAAWGSLVTAFVLAAAAFIGQQVLVPVQVALGELVARRIDVRIIDNLLEATLRPVGIGPLEDAQALDALKEATRQVENGWQTPGAACPALLALIARYLRLAGLVVIVGWVAGPVAGAAVGVATMIFRYGQRGGMRVYSRVWKRITPLLRRDGYLRDLGVDPAAAKELRVFGLTGWVSERYADSYESWMRVLWAERRRVFLWPYLAYTAVGLGVAGWVAIDVARSAAQGWIGLTALSLGLQAVVGAVLLGENYAESDLQTTFGMRMVSGRQRFTARVAELEPESVGEQAPGHPAAGMPAREVRLDGVRFSYPGSTRPVLDGLTLELPAGTCTAVVGVNGAGKTTLVKLLTRLHEPTGGALLVDGVDVRDLPVASWRRQVSVIFQDFVRYELSAADNVAFGAVERLGEEGTRAAVRAALAKVGLLEHLDALPDGLDTVLHRAYPGGADLSGGQWQRVAIARSLFAVDAGARLLVLDEPTSALDVRAEAEFFDHFVELTRGVTSLLISHRFSSVRRADRIVVIDAGRVVEQGSHDELMDADGHYARLFRLQAQRFAEGLGAEDDEAGVR